MKEETKDQLIKQLIIDEGLKLKPYRCTAGKLTIGIGRNLDDNPLTPDEVMMFLLSRPHIPAMNTDLNEMRRSLIKDFNMKGITREEAIFLLNNDIDKVLKECESRIRFFRSAQEELKSVLVNMAFNLGINGLLKFERTLWYMGAGFFKEASETMLQSKWAVQVGVRAKRLSERVAKCQN